MLYTTQLNAVCKPNGKFNTLLCKCYTKFMNGGSSVLRKSGFTIVELLVVIVVIGILAAITIVSYSGITNKAVSTVLQSDLINASNQLKIYQIDNGVFPTNIDCSIIPADGSICLKSSSNNAYTVLQTDNSSSQPTFCLTAVNSGIKYRITDNSRPELGTCNSTLTDGLVAYYPFNGDAKDYSGNGNDGTINGATLVGGVVGQAYSFDGVNDYISFPSSVSSALHGGSEATIEFWCKKNAVQYGFMQLSGFANLNGNLYPYDTTTKVYLDIFKTNRLGPITMPTSVLDFIILQLRQPLVSMDGNYTKMER